MENLLDNAVKYSPVGSTVELEAEAPLDRLRRHIHLREAARDIPSTSRSTYRTFIQTPLAAYSRVSQGVMNMSTSASCLGTRPVVPPMPLYRQLFVAVGNIYCRVSHNSISRPVGGRYHCWTCLRQFELKW